MRFQLFYLLLINLLNPLVALRGGKAASFNNFKFIVQIYDPQYLCVGSLINSQFVLTAAHCFTVDTQVKSLSVRAGEMKLINRNVNGHKVFGIQRHPKYLERNLKHDIAILRMNQSILESPHIGYASICKETLRSDNKVIGITAGWNVQKLTESLQSMDVEFIPYGTCSKSFSQLPTGTICGSGKKSNSTLCYGDSGDPLIYNNAICGIAVAFHRCGRLKHPDIYTDVYYHRQFISNAMKKLTAKQLKG